MKLDNFISDSLIQVKNAGLRPSVVHFDLYVHWDGETGDGTVISGAVTANGTLVNAPKPINADNLTGCRVSFAIPVSVW